MKSPSSSSKLINNSEFKYLPPEIWTQILSKFSAKTLLKFRCVCKYWRSVIDNPDFVHIHFQHYHINSENNASNKLLVALEGMGSSGDQGCLLTVRDAKTLGKIESILFKIHSYRYRLIGSCNGLLLVGRSRYTRSRYTRDPEELRLWNPCIRKSLILPTCPLCPLRTYLMKDRSWCLFGFAPDSKDYKVVAFGFDNCQAKDIEQIYYLFDSARDSMDYKMNFAVFTHSNQQWTVRNDPVNVRFLNNNISMFRSLSTAVFFGGGAHWLGKIDQKRIAFTHLGSFDFDQENLTLLELPFTCVEEGSLRFLFLFRGSLAVFSISEVSSSIWVLEQDNQKGPWTLWFSGKSSEDSYDVFELCHYKLQKVFYCESDGGYLVCGKWAYNIASGQVQLLKRYMSSHLKLETYLESLVLSKGYGARDLRSIP
ncbi:putative F-box only protein 9 [Silene latifolia]|uniref:putative F-box only protein 9 n=1 Tax=Silene latifolia TaxID=37657 RepID=UPI003D76C55E